MKVLSIGNSFSEDAQAYLHKLSLVSGINIDSTNLFIGGCSLDMHYNNMINNKADCSVDINSVNTGNYT